VPSSAPATPPIAPVVVPRLPGTPELAKDGSYVLSGGGLELTVDPRSAGNARRFSLDGNDVLAGPTAASAEPFSPEVEGSTLVLKSASGTQIKRYRLDTARRCVELSYTLLNTGNDPLRPTASELQRVSSAGGLTFFPGEARLLPGSTLKLNVWQPLVWFSHEQSREPRSVEALVPSSEGWLATVRDGLISIKTFGDVNKSTIVVRSAYDAETKQRPWVEVGAQTTFELLPGASATWNVRWFLRKLPAAIVAKAGNPELVGFVKGIIQ
jgi:hypothetical protein